MSMVAVSSAALRAADRRSRTFWRKKEGEEGGSVGYVLTEKGTRSQIIHNFCVMLPFRCTYKEMSELALPVC
jgi:hypothetical protein